jgi:hypothetical protein
MIQDWRKVNNWIIDFRKLINCTWDTVILWMKACIPFRWSRLSAHCWCFWGWPFFEFTVSIAPNVELVTSLHSCVCTYCVSVSKHQLRTMSVVKVCDTVSVSRELTITRKVINQITLRHGLPKSRHLETLP